MPPGGEVVVDEVDLHIRTFSVELIALQAAALLILSRIVTVETVTEY